MVAGIGRERQFMAESPLDRRVAAVTGAARGFGGQRARSLAGHRGRAVRTGRRAAIVAAVTTRVFVDLSHAFGAVVAADKGLPI